MRSNLTIYFSTDEEYRLHSLAELSALTCYLMRKVDERASSVARLLAREALSIPEDLYAKKVKDSINQLSIYWNEDWAIKARDNWIEKRLKK